MPKQLPEDLNARIMAAITRHPEGARINTLYKALSDVVSRRTLQRRLGDLVDQGQISAQGKGKARVYRGLGNIDLYVTGAGGIESAEAVGTSTIEAHIPLSRRSQETLNYVRRAIPHRTPVGYDRAFLEAYEPNNTVYLTQEIRDHLHHIGRSPVVERPVGTYARDIMNRLLIDLSWASSSLEGNTYTRLDTQNLIEFGKEADGKDQRETQMILNHKAAIEMLIEQVEDIGFNTFTFLNLHALLAENLLADPSEGGRLRTRIVEITGTVFHPLSIPQQIEQYFRTILEKADATHDPFEQAFFIMVHIPYLQPFVDVNKRVSRLGANIPFIRRNLCPLSFVDLPTADYLDGTLGVYELRQVDLLRDVFIWAYERSCQRYMAIKETVVQPDPVRLGHREALIAVVNDIVRGKQRPTKAAVRAEAKSLVPNKDLDHFVELVFGDLKNLHDGNVSRYRLRLHEYRAWQPLQVKVET